MWDDDDFWSKNSEAYIFKYSYANYVFTKIAKINKVKMGSHIYSVILCICLMSLVLRKWNGLSLPWGAIFSQEWPKVTGTKWQVMTLEFS